MKSIFLFFIFIGSSSGMRYKMYIDAGKPEAKTMSKFWASTGLCPPQPHKKADTFFLSEDMKLNLALIGGLSDDENMQIRIHWLLQLVNITFFNETPHFNFTLLDNFIDLIKMNGLKPGFEVMGNPNDLFRDFENETEVHLWRLLIKELATHCIDRYGLKYVQTWNFESWNEPDNHDFDNISMTLEGFLNYYDATSEGLLAAHQNLHLGGPGNRLIQGRSPISWALLRHCYNGTNYFTKQIGVRLDYLSIHQKGGGQSLFILQEEKAIFNYVKQLFPKFSNLPFYNDEADPMVGWNRPLPWRSDTTYAAIIAKIISQHWHMQFSSDNPLPTYSLLSNDNAFLSYQPQVYEQRTLTARFQVNNTVPPYVILIRKPSYNVLKLLSYLGETSLPFSISVNGSQILLDSSNIGAIITTHNRTSITDNWYLTALLYHSNDTNITNNITARIKFYIKNLPSTSTNQSLMASWFIMDNSVKTNPFLVWEQIGRPATPTRSQFRRMIEAEEPIIKGPFPISTTFYSKKFKLPLPGVRLLHICQKPLSCPGIVSNVRIYNITSNIVLITWRSKTVNNKCIKTYEIELSRNSSAGPYLRINSKDTIFSTFHFIPRISKRENETDSLVRGFYRIRIIDYWNRAGSYSDPIKYGLNSLFV